MNCVIKSKYYIRKEGRKMGKKGTYYGLGCLVNIYRVEQDLKSGPSRAWQDSVELGKIQQIAADCRQIAVSWLVSSC